MFCLMMGMVNAWDKFCAQSIPDVELLLFLSLPPGSHSKMSIFFCIVGNQLASIYRSLLSSGTEIIIMSVILELTKKILSCTVLSGMAEIALVKSSCTFPRRY